MSDESEEDEIMAAPRYVRRLEARVAALERCLSPAMITPRPRPRLDLDSGLDGGPSEWAKRARAGQVPRTDAEQWGPRHDPRVMAAVGTPEFAATLHAVEAEQAARVIDRRKDSDIMWRTRDGTPVRDGTVTGPPVQRSAHPGTTFWDQYPDHQPGFMTARQREVPRV